MSASALVPVNLNTLLAEVDDLVMRPELNTVLDLYKWCDSQGLAVEEVEVGFRVTTKSGYTFSIKCGPFHYCENRSWEIKESDKSWDEWLQSKTAEVGVFKPNGDWYIPENAYHDPEFPPTTHTFDWQTVDQILDLIEYFK